MIDSDLTNEIDFIPNHRLPVGVDGLIGGLVVTDDGQVAKWDAALCETPTATLDVAGDFRLEFGATVNQIATDFIMTAKSDDILPNVGIGTVTPTAKLDVDGNLVIGTGSVILPAYVQMPPLVPLN